MASDLNVVVLVGRLTKDCTIRSTNSGKTVCHFSLAVKKSRKDTSGNWVDQVNYFNIVYFLSQNSGLSQYLIKGQQVSIDGELRQNVWEQNGQKRYDVEVVVTSLSLLARPKNAGGFNDSNSSRNNYYNAPPTPPTPPVPPVPRPPQAPQAPQAPQVGPEGYDDDIPF